MHIYCHVCIICSGQKSDETEEKFLLIASHLDAYGIDPQSVQVLHCIVLYLINELIRLFT